MTVNKILQLNNLTPRDLNAISLLREHGLSLVEVKISQVSFAKGHLLANIRLPENTRLVAVLRQGRAILDLEAVFLEEKDSVLLLTDDEVAVRSAFTV